MGAMEEPSDAAKFIVETEWQSLSPTVQERVKQLFVDLLGSLIAGSTLHASQIAREWVSAYHRGSEAGIWPGSNRASLSGAVFANALAANALDIDDGYRPVKGHPGSCVIPAALALAEFSRSSGKDLLSAILVGYEVGLRAGRTLHASYNDYHCSGSWGALAACAAASRLLHLDVVTVDNALGIAEYFAPIGLMMRCIQHPSMLKDGIAWGAMTGISSALLAQMNFLGSPHLLHRSAALSPAGEQERACLEPYGSKFLVQDVYLKPYACCRWAQPAVDAVLGLREQLMAENAMEGDLRFDVSEIVVETFYEATQLHVRRPESTEEAQYSLPWAVACAWAYGQVGVAEVREDHLLERKVRDLADRVRMIASPEFDAEFPLRTKARVRISFHHGLVLESKAFDARGEPGNQPLSEAEVYDKFRSLTVPVIGESRSEHLLKVLVSIDELENLSELWSILADGGV
ncbi:MAG: MmgE/PrpD family protein [Alicyclobacillus sp.]|nr:MmgE/PrpD family protein [Alicyclobacillus sp.]